VPPRVESVQVQLPPAQKAGKWGKQDEYCLYCTVLLYCSTVVYFDPPLCWRVQVRLEAQRNGRCEALATTEWQVTFFFFFFFFFRREASWHGDSHATMGLPCCPRA